MTPIPKEELSSFMGADGKDMIRANHFGPKGYSTQTYFAHETFAARGWIKAQKAKS